jgi:two-component system NtrC family response regulator
VVSATNRNLEEMIEEGKFRKIYSTDLKEVVFICLHCGKGKKIFQSLITFFLKTLQDFTNCHAMLQQMDWPGNIRELKMTIISLAGMCQNNEKNEEDVLHCLI